jgi:outer membrane protein assembly factor BamB
MNAMRRPLLLAPWAGLLAAALAAGDANWPQFRGPGARGFAEDAGLPDVWDTMRNVVWRADVPGRGWSSPVVWGDRVFVTSVISEGKEEEAKKGLYFGGERPKPPAAVHRWMVYCLDLATGKRLWEAEAHKGPPQSTRHIKNSFASETPVTDGERVYAYFGNLGLFCYDRDGKKLWDRRWGPFKTRYGWGTAASPVLHRGRLYLVNDNEEDSFLVALDPLTGQDVWRVARDEKSNWATPYIWENEKRTEIVTPGTGKVRSYDLDGKLLWELKGMSTITIPTPFSAFGLLYVGSGYILDKLRPLYAIRPGASGDISLGPDQTSNEYIAWCQKTAGPYNPSFLVYGDYLYVLYDRGEFACYEAKTGKEVYPRRRIGPGATAFTASPWAYGGKVFCLSEDGDTFVIQAGPEYRLLGKNSVGETCLATPALAGGSLLLRTESKLYCLRQGAGGK